jgi:hypothetical protein
VKPRKRPPRGRYIVTDRDGSLRHPELVGTHVGRPGVRIRGRAVRDRVPQLVVEAEHAGLRALRREAAPARRAAAIQVLHVGLAVRPTRHVHRAHERGLLAVLEVAGIRGPRVPGHTPGERLAVVRAVHRSVRRGARQRRTRHAVHLLEERDEVERGIPRHAERVPDERVARGGCAPVVRRTRAVVVHVVAADFGASRRDQCVRIVAVRTTARCGGEPVAVRVHADEGTGAELVRHVTAVVVHVVAADFGATRVRVRIQIVAVRAAVGLGHEPVAVRVRVAQVARAVLVEVGLIRVERVSAVVEAVHVPVPVRIDGKRRRTRIRRRVRHAQAGIPARPLLVAPLGAMLVRSALADSAHVERVRAARERRTARTRARAVAHAIRQAGLLTARHADVAGARAELALARHALHGVARVGRRGAAVLTVARVPRAVRLAVLRARGSIRAGARLERTGIAAERRGVDDRVDHGRRVRLGIRGRVDPGTATSGTRILGGRRFGRDRSVVRATRHAGESHDESDDGMPVTIEHRFLHDCSVNAMSL